MRGSHPVLALLTLPDLLVLTWLGRLASRYRTKSPTHWMSCCRDCRGGPSSTNSSVFRLIITLSISEETAAISPAPSIPRAPTPLLTSYPLSPSGPPVSVFLAQISVSRSPGLLSGLLRTWGLSSDFRVELMAISNSLAWKSQARAAVAVDSLHRDAFTARIRVARTCGPGPDQR